MRTPSVPDALAQLQAMAAEGCPPDEVAHKAEAIAAGWWWRMQDGLAPDRLALLVQALQRCCVLAAVHQVSRWDQLTRAGQIRQAREAAQRARAFDGAQQALRVYA